jgi:hypothetical protein
MGARRPYVGDMPTLTIELPAQTAQTQFNLRRWAELLADRELARIEGRIETDRFGHVTLTPPPAPAHGGYQSQIGVSLDVLLTTGRVTTVCPISTADGGDRSQIDRWTKKIVGADVRL